MKKTKADKFIDWINKLPLQTLTDDLKRDIIEEFEGVIAIVDENPTDLLTDWDWVIEEYFRKFSDVGKTNINQYRGKCVERVRELFSVFPGITKELILEATDTYLDTCAENGWTGKYIINPHYFLRKGAKKGINGNREIINYIRLNQERKASREAIYKPNLE